MHASGHEEAAAGMAPAAASGLGGSAGARHLVGATLLVRSVAGGAIGALADVVTGIGELVLSSIRAGSDLVADGLAIGVAPRLFDVRLAVAGLALEVVHVPHQ